MIAQQYCTGNEGWEEELQAIFVDLKDNLLSKSEILNIFHYFQYCLLSRITEMSEEYNEVWKKQIQPELSAVLNGFETLQELEEKRFMKLRRRLATTMLSHLFASSKSWRGLLPGITGNATRPNEAMYRGFCRIVHLKLMWIDDRSARDVYSVHLENPRCIMA